MQATDRKKFLETINGLQSIKPGKELTAAALDLWWNSLRHWSIEEFVTAASHLACSVEFMPSPFHFEQLRKASKPTTAEAWQTVLKRCLAWRTHREDRDVIDRAVAGIGGYRAVAMADVDTALPHVQRRFIEAYEQLDETEKVRAALPHIQPAPGINFRDGKFTAIGAPLAGGRGRIGEIPRISNGKVD